MKNKKGFTLIEIIIVIALISVIGVGSLVSINLMKKNNVSEATKKVLDAANVYLSMEKDEEGDIYLNGIENGGKGLLLTVQTLVDKGYINNNIVKDLINETNQKNLNKLKLLATKSIYDNNNINCSSDSLIEFSINWSSLTGSNKYLCPKGKILVNPECPKCECAEKKSLTTNILAEYPKNTIQSLEIDRNSYYKINSVSGSYGENAYYCKNNGLFKYNNDTYYYRGDVGDNYIKINNEMFRILNFKENGPIKIIREEKLYFDSYSTDATGSLKNRFNNTYLYKTLNNYLSDFIGLCPSYYSYNFCDELLQTNIYCDQPKVIKYEHYLTQEYTCSPTPCTLSIETCSNEYNLNSNIGVITYNDAVLAGAYLYPFANYGYTEPYTSNSWLSSGDTSITMTPIIIGDSTKELNKYKYQFVLSNSLKDDNPFGTGEQLGTFNLLNLDYYANLNEKYFYVRPVISIKDITVIGKGTRQNPYTPVIE